MEFFVEPVATCRVKVGVFTFTQNGTEGTAEFSVICEGPSDDDCVCARNMQAYNSQLTDEWTRLEEEGYRNIRFLEIEPFPLC